MTLLAGVTATSASAADGSPLTAPAAVSPAPDCGGSRTVNVAGLTWVCTFDDEFDASTGDATSLDRAKWVPQVTATSGTVTGSPTGYACYVDSPNNISVSGGSLHLTVRKESSAFACGTPAKNFQTPYTSGMVSTRGLFSQTYGRFVVRAKLPAATTQGLQETLWLYPNDTTKYGPWPGSGEIDFGEFYSQFPRRDVPYVHYYSDSISTTLSNTLNQVTAYNCVINSGEFNTYSVDWVPGTLLIKLNGRPCVLDRYVANGGLSGAAPFDQPFFINLTQALGRGTNALLPGITPLPATTDIDYVRAWGPQS